MVNTTSTMESTHATMPLFSVSPSKFSKSTADNFIQSLSSSLFNLSKPFNVSYKFNSDQSTINSKVNYNTSTFIFPEPFESHHMNNYNGGGGGKLTNKTSSKRLQPYCLSKPNKNTNGIGNVEENGSANNSSNGCLSVSNSSSTNSNSNISSVSQCPDQQPNAILARLSNISNSFKSIFVRPKNSKPVDLVSFNQRVNNNANSNNANSSDHNDPTKFKLNLFSVSSGSKDHLFTGERSTFSTATSNSYSYSYSNSNSNSTSTSTSNSNSNNFDMNQKLEKIISQNVRMESYTNKMDKKPNTTSTVYNSLQNGSKHSDSSSTISSMSSAQSQVDSDSNAHLHAPGACKNENMSSYAQSSTLTHHQRAFQMSNNGNIVKLETNVVKQNTNKTSNPPPINGPICKWTCMVCLSKHTLDIKICLICGSANSDSINKPSVQISINSMSKTSYDAKTKMLFNDISNDCSANRSRNHSHLNSPLRTLNNTTGLKIWKCSDCNFANDNLKIVCMNCRASKQQISKGVNPKLTHQTLQTKRRPKQIMEHKTGDHKSERYRLNRSNEENELASDEDEQSRGRSSKKSRKHEPIEKFCKNCQNCLQLPVVPEVEVRTPTSQCGNKCEQKGVGDTPLRPKLFEPEASNANCTCKDSGTKCNNCNAIESQERTITVDNDNTILNENNKTQQNQLAPANKPATNLLFASSSTKWPCTTCLASNESDKTKCACCQTERQSTKSTQPTQEKKSTNGLMAAAAVSGGSKWSCSTCLASNESDKTNCACCQTARQSQPTEKPKSNALFAAASLAKNSKWSCDVCLASNENDKTACACCQTKRPGLAAAATDQPKTNVFGLNSTQSSDNKWSCGTCLVKNESDKTSCACCSTPRTGSGTGSGSGSGSTTTSNEPKTKFSSLVAAASTLNTSSSISTSTTSSISFGLNPAKSADQQTTSIKFTTSTFGSTESTAKPTFGSNPTTTPASNKPTFSSTNLTFGVKVNSEPNKPPEAASMFSFGQKQASSEDTSKASLFGSNNASTNGNTFGSSSGSSGSSGSSSNTLQISNPFSNQISQEKRSVETSNEPPAKPFAFMTASNTKKEEQAVKSSVFGFGSASSTDNSAKPVFGFGSTKTSETTKSAFAFGAATAEVAKPSFFGNASTNNEAPKNATKSMFGSTSTPTPTSTSSNMFGSSSTSSTSSFGNTKPDNTFEVPKPSTPTPFNFGSTQAPAPAPTPAQTTNFFGNSSNSTSTPAFGTNLAPATTNVFGQLNQNLASSKSAFNFGQTNTNQANTGASTAFQFGQDIKPNVQTKKQAFGNDENKPLAFNFNGAQTNSDFKFGGANTNDTSHKIQSLQTQPAAAAAGSPFVFGGLSSKQASTDSPSLSQILTGPPTTPSTAGRPIKKATRMRKK